MQGAENSAQESQSQFQETASPSAGNNDKLNMARKHVENQQIKEAIPLLSSLLKGGNADQSICLVADLCKAGHSATLIRSDFITRPLMKYFNRLCKQLEMDMKKQETEYGMLKVLCLVSQLIHENPSHRFPFNKKFVANIFLLDAERLGECSRKISILRVVSVILQALSRRIRLLKEFGMLKRLKYMLLESYSLTEQLQTLKRLNSAIKNVAVQQPVTIGEALKYKLMATMSKFVSAATSETNTTENTVKIQNN